MKKLKSILSCKTVLHIQPPGISKSESTEPIFSISGSLDQWADISLCSLILFIKISIIICLMVTSCLFSPEEEEKIDLKVGGTVTDAISNEPIQNTTINLFARSNKANSGETIVASDETDPDGKYYIKCTNIDKNKFYHVEVEKQDCVGYGIIHVRKTNEYQNIDFKLLQPVSITIQIEGRVSDWSGNPIDSVSIKVNSGSRIFYNPDLPPIIMYAETLTNKYGNYSIRFNFNGIWSRPTISGHKEGYMADPLWDYVRFTESIQVFNMRMRNYNIE